MSIVRPSLSVLSMSVLLTALIWLGAATALAESPDYQNPLVEQRADPWVLKHTDGYYYFIATAPEYDRIEIRRAQTLEGLGEASAQVVWRKHDTGPMGANIWAPELHYMDGTWVIYFAAGDAEKPWLIRMYALTSTAENPLDSLWQEAGKIETPWDSFALDATSFTHKGKRYLVWAQKDRADTYNSALLMAELALPVKIKPPVVVLSEPELPWEIIGYKVNEGAAVIQRHGRVFISYSASATDHNYAMGLLWADTDADLMNPASWHKSPEPVFYTNTEVERFGPGHNSFTVAEDGVTDVMIYHARNYRDIQGNPLADPNRHTRARTIGWDAQGMPVFQQSRGD